jgi:hypothetical protein
MTFPAGGKTQDLALSGTIGLDHHEFAPGLRVLGLLASPREVLFGNVRVSSARIGVGGHRLFEHLSTD